MAAAYRNRREERLRPSPPSVKSSTGKRGIAMEIKAVSTAYITHRIAESRDFYVTHFGAKVTFDCGWYVNLGFPGGGSLQFMSPQEPELPPAGPTGLTYNILVEDVDAAHRALSQAGLALVLPLEDHPWGDRGFSVRDPNGINLYIHSPIEPSEEYKIYFSD